MAKINSASTEPVDVLPLEVANWLQDALDMKPRHPGDFDEWPSDRQMEDFKRGGR